ncbi:MAG TPA: hypothetical protein P5107_11540 [Thermotogota bacterium]|nr:hypothetical protein [Thermotogota bacterium]
MTNSTLIMGISILFVTTVIAGIVLSHLGRPLNTALFSIHKLIGIGMVVLSVIAFVRLFKLETLPEGPVKIFVIIAAVSLIALIATGGLLSFDRFSGKFIVILHTISTVIAGFSIGILLFAFLKR